MSCGNPPPSALIAVLEDAAGGAERVAAATAKELARRGWRVHLLVVFERPAVSFLEDSAGPDVRITYGRGRGAAALALLPLRLWRASGVDLAMSTHIHVNAALSLARRLGLLRTRRLVARESTQIFQRFSGRRLQVYRALYGLYGAHDLIVAQTDAMREALEERLPARITRQMQVIPNPVDVERIHALAAEPLADADQWLIDGRANLVFCGRLIPVKQPLLALETVARLPASTRPRLVMLGDGEMAERVRAEALRLGVDGDVRLLGQRRNPYQIMAACHAGLLTSEREGFPNVILEMLTCGVQRVVTTPCAGGLAELPCVLVAEHFSPEVLAALLDPAASPPRPEERKAAIASRAIAGFVTRLIEPSQTG